MNRLESSPHPLLARVSGMSLGAVCSAFEATNDIPKPWGPDIPTVRGALMDELERRNPSAFESWLDTSDLDSMDRPSVFFL